MFRYYLSKVLMKLWALLLSVGVLAIIMGLRGWFILYDIKRLNPMLTFADIVKLSIITGVIGIIIIVFCVLTRKHIQEMRIKGLEASRFDEYGRLKGQDNYYELSLAAQKKMDEERRQKLNAVLPVSEVKQLTHKGSSDPAGDMDKLVGLQEVKDKMEEMVAQMEFEKKHNMQHPDTANHMNMYGPPGTGKTTVARIMTGFLMQNGYIKRNEVIEVSGSFLTTADAATKAEALCQYAYGGVLFIDEAYAMTNSHEGQEAIAALVKELEDSKDKFILIMAGYENEMKRLLNSNPGFLSRIKEHFYFKNYSLSELKQIFEDMANHLGYQVDPLALEKVGDVLSELESDTNFGNARTCRNILDKTLMRHALNIKKGSTKRDFVIEKQDIVYNNSL